ncbi:MAG TPA: tryptophan synthase subunit alpha [Acidimicrobiales bacterium]|nr:MAG: tryptophan synthase subunit alpha [Actinobacteria bacterium 21-73-9]HQU25674.1 tryptophan synthase subunit alpha [Acidimicrobiales bacterium]
MTTLDERLRAVREGGRRALVPYLMAGSRPDWVRLLEAAVAGGADAIEVGLPFSDPMMDGPVIQEAALAALAAGTTLDSVCAELASLELAVPLVAMTYCNVVYHYGLERAAGRLREAGVLGTILPDLALEELGEWAAVSDACDLATVLMVAPSTPPERVARLAARSRGFVYAAARMAVTGTASGLGDGAAVAERVREASSTPVYIGIGIATAEQARAAARAADGVIVGSALVRRVLDGRSPEEVESFVRELREALDEM